MAEHDQLMIRFSEGRGGMSQLGKVKNRTLSWAAFKKMLSAPTRTKETRKQFDKLPIDEQHKLKAVDGYIMASPMRDGNRNRASVMPRDLLSYDYDHTDTRMVDRMFLGALPVSNYEFFVHTTRRHRPDAPRLRIYFPLSRPVTAEEYGPFSRIVAFIVEDRVNPMPLVDEVSFRPAQLMFKPTVSVDNEFWTYHNEGSILDPDAIFAWFQENYGDPQDYSILPRTINEGDLRKAADKAEDPTTKKGPVGDFCRAYDIIAAIDKFLPDIYVPVDDASTKPRYTYTKGSSSSGAVVEDGGLFLYSHHGTDPCAEMLVNSFDMVRLHLFGELDEGEDKDTPPTKWPSYKKMVEFLSDDEGYRHSQAASRYDLSAMFDDVMDDEDIEIVEQEDGVEDLGHGPSIADKFDALDDDSVSGAGSPVDMPRKAKKPNAKPPKDWFPDALTLDQNGKIEHTMPNAAVIVHNDARMFGAIAFNGFSKQIVARRSIRSKLDITVSMVVQDVENGDPWQDFNDITIRSLLEAPNGEGKVGYGMRVTDRDLTAAISLAARRNEFHPIREFLDDVAERFGRDDNLIETLFIRHLGVEDNAYHRETAKWVMVASVARIFEPGHKFDFAPILQGETGIRKSSFIKALYGERYFGEIDCNLGDTQAIAEIIAGIWGGELPELQGLHKADHNAAKAFMRRQIDKVRMAYDRRVSNFPRQMVVWGTTNDRKYLKDPTGNRSYWPIVITIEEIDTDALSAERERLWAAAVHVYRAMRAEQPKGELPLYLQSREARLQSVELQESARTEELHEIWAYRIGEWADEPVTLHQLYLQMGLSPDETFADDEDLDGDTMVLRCAFTREQAVEFALKKDRGETDYQTVQNVGRALPEIKGWFQKKAVGDRGGHQQRVLGKKGRWHFREDATLEERKKGFKIVPSADAEESDFSHLI